jgi:hypothetical protein
MVFLERDSVTRFLTLGFFHQSIPPKALIHGLKPFCIWLRFRRENQDNRLQSLDPIGFCGLETAGSVSEMTKIFNFIYIFSVVHCRSHITFHVGSHGLNETAEIL